MTTSRPIFVWQVGSRGIELGRRTRVMAILNLTPDSFYAPSRIAEPLTGAAAAAESALAAGADALDLGAESTRPGAAPLAPEEEQRRLLPVLKLLRARFPQALLSADTRHAATARAALDAGADIVNDVTGLEDPEMLAVAARSGCGVVAMHHRGEFATMQHLPPLADPFAAVSEGLRQMAERAIGAGIRREQLVLDPGFGFGKNLDENFPLLARLGELRALGFPILAGMSRKSFLRRDRQHPPEQRLIASLAAATAAALAGAHWLRVHDVAETVEAVRIADAILAARP